MPTMPTTGPKFRRRQQVENWFKRKEELEKLKQEGKLKPERIWHLEDSRGNHKYEGRMEGGQEAHYALLMMEGPEFKVYPVDEWHEYKKKKLFRGMSLEQAEAVMRTKKLVEETRAKNFFKQEEQNPGEEIKEEEDNPYGGAKYSDLGLFLKPEKKTGETGEAPVQRKEAESVLKDEGGGSDVERDRDEGAEELFDEDRGEAPDFETNISDDEEELMSQEEEEEGPKRKGGEEEDDKGLTEYGKEIRKILRDRRKEEGMESSDDEDEDEEAPYEEETTIKRPPKPEPFSRIHPIDAAVLVDSTEEAKKRPLAVATTDQAPKRIKVEPQPPTAPGVAASAAPPAAAGTGEISEDEILKSLLLSGKIRTKALIAKFKSRLKGPQAKGRFLGIVKRLATIVEDAGDKFVILKDQYRGGLKVGK